MSESTVDDTLSGNEVAIIGMAGRFPGSANLKEYWQNLLDGVESVTFFTDDQLRAAGESERSLRDPNYVRASPALSDFDRFDASFFGFSPRDASIMDPAHRLFLEVAWSALEHAGRAGLPHEGAVGVFATSGASVYLMDNLRTNPHLVETIGDFLLRHTGNDASFLATRVSYELDLRGPSVNVQTACSSALVATHMACQSLLNGECDLALAGGSTVMLPQGRGYLYRDGEILARDGHCRPFDSLATGTIFGSGVGAVVLARLSDAIANRDTIYAVVRGAAINNDGSVKVGFLAPSVDGQAACIAEALALSGVPPRSLGYVEAHGTGTRIGDPIEVAALTQAFRRFTQDHGFCALGSVKSNIGHLGEAAGVAALIKTALTLHHGELPPSLHFERANEQIDFASSPFFVNARRRPFTSTHGPRRAGITSLGAGGTNCHVVLEQAPPREPSSPSTRPELVVLSARSHMALDAMTQGLSEAVDDPSLPLADIAHTLQVGRRALTHRRVFVARSRDDARSLLRSVDPSRVVTEAHAGRAQRVAFLFPGGGAQYSRMGAELYEKERVYREAFDACLACLGAADAQSLRETVFADESRAERASIELERPSRALPALFATEYALAELLRSWGLEPDALCGHSMGEYVAACLSGVFSLRSGMQLVALRGRLFEKTARGGMLVVSMSSAELETSLPPGVDIAAINAPGLCVASGPVEALDRLAKELSDREVDTVRVHIEVAAHSAMLDPILQEFREFCRSVRFSPPTRRMLSNLTGTWLSDAEATDPEYWVRHLRGTVKFSDCLETLFASGIQSLVEVGPGRTLSSLGRAQGTHAALSVNSMRHPKEPASDLEYALRTVGRAWAAGASVDWSKLREGELRNRVALPTYPFERSRYWVEPGRALDRAVATEDSLQKLADPEAWFSTLSWARAAAPLPRAGSETERYLVFLDGQGFGRRLAQSLGGAGATTVVPGRALIKHSADAYEIDPNDPEQFERLVRELHEEGRGPTRVVYLWTLGLGDALGASRGAARAIDSLSRRVSFKAKFASSREACFAAPFHLCRGLGAYGAAVELTVVTAGLFAFGDHAPDPMKSLALGPVLVAPREFPMLRARVLDLGGNWLLGRSGRRAIEQVGREVAAPVDARCVAFRGPDRWVRRVEPCALPAPGALPLGLRDGACVLITGALGGVGLEIAGAFAALQNITLVLLSRGGLPPEEARDGWLKSRAAGDATSLRITRVRALQAQGARVLVRSLDVTDTDALRALFAELAAGGTKVTGIVHAAGQMDDALMLEKTLPETLRVMAAKVDGALALDAASSGAALDFFVVFSSVASFLGLPGQCDYTAANAFLDAFAARRSALGRGRTLAINWNAWREVGMAAALLSPRAAREVATLPHRSAAHPAFAAFVETRDGFLFYCDLSRETHWFVSEHRVRGGRCLVPGTAHIELLRAAFAQAEGEGPVRLRDLRFLRPVLLDDSATTRLFLRLVRTGAQNYEALIFEVDEATPSVSATLEPLCEEQPAPLDLEALRGLSSQRTDEIGGFMRQNFMDFGPRWANLVRASYGARDALIELELPASLGADLGAYHFHPALADMATGSVQDLSPGFDPSSQFFVPFSYDTVDLFAPLEASLLSHVRAISGTAAETAVFDVRIASRRSEVLVEARGFTMRRVTQGGLLAEPSETPPRVLTPNDVRVQKLLAEAISPDEGSRAFLRVLGGFEGAQCTVSSVDVVAWMNQLDASAKEPAGRVDAKQAGFARPSLGTAYVAPRTPAEELVARVWSELLGIDAVGVNDDFHDLGGQSLLAIRMLDRIKRETGTSLALSTLFDSPTIARVAARLDAQPHNARSFESIVPIREGARRGALFMPHGVGGTVHWGYANLVKYLDPTLPVYGLKVAPESCQDFKSMCAFYLKEIREIQPFGPYMLAGYCYGGNVAFEIASQMRAAGEQVGLLALIEAWPVNTEFGKVSWSPEYARRFAENLPFFAASFLNRPWRDQVEMVQHRLAALRERLSRPKASGSADNDPTQSSLERLGPPPRGADMLDVRSLGRYGEGEIEIWERCVRALWQHVPVPVDTRALVIRTRRQPLFSPHDPEMGWRPLATRGLDAYTVPGSHFSIMDVPDVAEAARLIDAAIREITPSGPRSLRPSSAG